MYFLITVYYDIHKVLISVYNLFKYKFLKFDFFYKLKTKPIKQEIYL